MMFYIAENGRAFWGSPARTRFYETLADAVEAVRFLERDMNRATDHSPYTILPLDHHTRYWAEGN